MHFNQSSDKDGGDMFDRLLKRFIQEVPEHLSACEFDCPLITCTESDWARCEIRQPGTLSGSYSAQTHRREVEAEIPVSVLASN